MAFVNTTYRLFLEASLTTEFGGILQFVHDSDFSDNPQDGVLHLGSNTAGLKLEADSNPGVDDIVITPVDILPDWTASTVFAVGDAVEPTVDDTYWYQVQSITGTGETGATEPTFNTGEGSTTVDNEVTWVCMGKNHQLSEIKLSSTAVGLDAAVAGASLVLGTEILSGAANSVEIHYRIENAVSNVRNTAGKAHIGFSINTVLESAA